MILCQPVLALVLVVWFCIYYLFITLYPNLFFNEHKYVTVSHLYDRHNIVTEAFLFPILTLICLLLPLRQPRFMQLSVFPLSLH